MSRDLTLAGYAVLLVALACWAVIAHRRHVSFGQLVAMIAVHRVAKWLLLAGWFWLGWHLFVRATH